MDTWDWRRVHRNSHRSLTSFSQLPCLPQQVVYNSEVGKYPQGQLAAEEQWTHQHREEGVWGRLALPRDSRRHEVLVPLLTAIADCPPDSRAQSLRAGCRAQTLRAPGRSGAIAARLPGARPSHKIQTGLTSSAKKVKLVVVYSTFAGSIEA